MIRYAVIAVLLVFVAVLADRVVREENQRYALLLNMCPATDAASRSNGFPSFECLDKVQTRTSWAWHLWYGVTDPLPAVDWTSS